jgi:hypothetical protein
MLSKLSYGRYQYDAERLIDLIQRVLAEAPGAGVVHRFPAAPDTPGPTLPSAEGAGGEVAQKGLEAGRDDLRAARLLTEAEGIARSLTDEDKKAAALSGVAKALAATDPDRAGQLFTDAERIAQSIDVEKAGALTEVAQALAAIDPDHAERFADSLSAEEYPKAAALRGIWRRWQPPRLTAPKASPAPSSTKTWRQRRWPRSQRRWQPPTPTARARRARLRGRRRSG